ncbi:MAG TPA: hypothetical protein DCS19_02075 [Flavobacterium sp.]|nr:hypothetical protein [Flavobacterium sp.]
MKILDLLLELKGVVTVSGSDIVKASKSKISTLNNPNFAKMVKGWEKGIYDKNPETLYFEVAGLLDKEKIK